MKKVFESTEGINLHSNAEQFIIMIIPLRSRFI
jgi:hypothetical protein